MVADFRPHMMLWSLPAGEATKDENGYPIPGAPGQSFQTPCRFHLESTKVYKNKDNTVSNQVGTIRCDVGDIPEVGQLIEVRELSAVSNGGEVIVIEGETLYVSREVHFTGPIKATYKGQLSYRLEV